MSLGEVLLHGVEYTIIGMGTVFAVLIFISFCIKVMSSALKGMDAAMASRAEAKAAKAAGKAADAGETPADAAAEPVAASDDSGLSPEIVAAIMAALQMKLDGDIGVGGYRLRKIRRAEWRHM